MYSQREKISHFNRLRAGLSRLEPDLAFLKKIDPSHPLLKGPSINTDKFADNVLSALLDVATACDIKDFRREYAKNKISLGYAETLKQRFDNYIASADNNSHIDVNALIKHISEGLPLLAGNFIDETDVLPNEIELISVDNEKYKIKLTDAAKQARLDKLHEALAYKMSELSEKEEKLNNRESGLDNKESESQAAEQESESIEKSEESALNEFSDTETETAETEKKSEPKKKNTRK